MLVTFSDDWMDKVLSPTNSEHKRGTEKMAAWSLELRIYEFVYGHNSVLNQYMNTKILCKPHPPTQPHSGDPYSSDDITQITGEII